MEQQTRKRQTICTLAVRDSFVCERTRNENVNESEQSINMSLAPESSSSSSSSSPSPSTSSSASDVRNRSCQRRMVAFVGSRQHRRRGQTRRLPPSTSSIAFFAIGVSLVQHILLFVIVLQLSLLLLLLLLPQSSSSSSSSSSWMTDAFTVVQPAPLRTTSSINVRHRIHHDHHHHQQQQQQEQYHPHQQQQHRNRRFRQFQIQLLPSSSLSTEGTERMPRSIQQSGKRTDGTRIRPNNGNSIFGRFFTRSIPSASSTLTASSKATTTTTTQLFCQLLGMNCRTATEMSISWPTFCERGGGTDIHADGWGLVYYVKDGQGIRQFHDVEAASKSPLAHFIGQQHIQTSNMMAHIRYATSGSVDLANVHPFTREMWGLNWCFAHNGQVPLYDDHPDHCLSSGTVMSNTNNNDNNKNSMKINGNHHHDHDQCERFYSPIGTTDSEATFCAILNALRAKFRNNMPTLPVLYENIRTLCDEIVAYDRDNTILNFLLTCGPHNLWVYSWPGQRPGSKTWNGLHYTVRSTSTKFLDDDYDMKLSMPNSDKYYNKTNEDGCSNDLNGCATNDLDATTTTTSSSSSSSTSTNGECTTCESCCIVATKPLTTDEEWIELQRGELILFDGGLPHVSPSELFRVELQGHGLNHYGQRAPNIQKPRLEEDMRRYEFNPEYFVAGGI